MNDVAAQGPPVVCFALTDESRFLTAGLRGRRTRRSDRHLLPLVDGRLEDDRPVSIIHTGVGDSAAAREFLAGQLAGAQPPPCAVISAGYAGALHSGLKVGDLVLAENYSSPALLASARVCLTGEPVHAGFLLTKPTAAENAATKRSLHERTGALAVDMETAWIAAKCAAAGIPLLSLRVISDAADQDFPVPYRVLYDQVRQRPRYLALPVWLAMHPGQIAPFTRFVRGLGPARERLTRALRTVLAGL